LGSSATFGLPIMTTLGILSLLFATAAVFGLISHRWLRLPDSIGTMLLTMLVSAGLSFASYNIPEIRQWAATLVLSINFENLILRGMLPLLLFAGAFLLDLDLLAQEKLTVSMLAVGGTGLSFFLIAALMSLLSGGSLPWIQCLIFGALITPTDPIAVLEMLRRSGVPGRVQAQLAGESLFNDGLGAVLFLTMLEIASGHAPTPWRITGLLAVAAGGGILLGISAAWLTSRMMRLANAFQIDILFTVALALGGYFLAQKLHVSGPLEAVAAGIAMRYFNHKLSETQVAHTQIDHFWAAIDHVQNSILFVLLGLEALAITLNAPVLRAGFAAILSVNAVRFAVIALLLVLLRAVRPGHLSSAFVLAWGGLRGGLSIALALSVPEALGRSWMLGATYVVVVFSVVIEGGSMGWLIRHRGNAQLS
jgi:monovalent cation:H+ antiporter, CPA1 family